MLLLAGVTSNAEHLVAGFLATMGFRGWALDVGFFPFDLLYLSSVFLARGVTGSGGQVCFGLNRNLHRPLNLFGRSRRFELDREIKIKIRIKIMKPGAA